ncbi:hypothetical protein EDD37DRAFT_417681 [Exophiala viscosa]|uniref:uncharacterized protein n=1 Tax=Exophiala viscosa TaxID=2486360 RepID=UPI0021921EBB|nr:hypothetical protein EDD37DRAFT_417681 [Exophiala viscosa]
MRDIFRPLFRTPEERAANRKEQLRRAQRTFRERKENYLRLLEKQVTSLLKNEIDTQVQIQHLQSRVSRLEARLNESESENQKLHTFVGSHDGHGMGLAQAPNISANAMPDINDPSDRDPVNAVIWVESKGAQAAHLHIRNTSQGNNPGQLPSPDLSPIGNAHADAITKHESVSVGGQMMAQLRHPPQFSDKVCLMDMDLITVGMEFVLKLENPCLPHILQASSSEGQDQDSPHGHVHLATHALLCCSRDTPKALPSGSTWQAPKDTLKRLLDYSPELPIEDSEMSPVQAWQQITLHPHFHNLKLENLNVLSDRLLQDIKCYGFGAVVRQEFLEKLLSTT